MSVVLLCPVLARPERVRGLLDSVAASIVETPVRCLFIASAHDDAELRALGEHAAEHVVVPWPWGPGDYARKINHGYAVTDEPWMFLAADDLRFRPGWADATLAVARKSGARVIGTNDLGNPQVIAGRHSTHTLVARSYVDKLGTIDEPGKVLHEGYSHNFVDDELVGTAKSRGEWRFAKRAVVEHLHPSWGKGAVDPTYQLGRAGFDEDHALFMERRALWWPEGVDSGRTRRYLTRLTTLRRPLRSSP